MRSDDAQRSIGKAISVAADRFVVELNRGGDSFTVVGFDDIHYVAALGSFVMLPVATDYVVAEVVGLWEKDPSSGRTAIEGVELDKAASAKFLELVPVGMLPQSPGEGFRFGVSAYPALYVDALYALESELDRIFEVADHVEPVGSDAAPNRLRALEIGSSVVFKGYPVKAKVDELFGGHAAVLGNTGSGKSCTVATILQALFDKRDELAARGATFVVLDVNGEYRCAFTGLPDTIRRSYLRVADEPTGIPPVPLDANEVTTDFRLPHWFMTVEEWELLLRASERTQQPVLRMALGLTSLLGAQGEAAAEIKRHVVASCAKECFRADSPVSKAHRLRLVLERFGDEQLGPHLLSQFHFNEQFGNFPGNNTEAFLAHVGGFILDDAKLPGYTGEPFDFAVLEDCFEIALLYEEAHGNKQIRDYCSQMLTRFKRIATQSEYGFMRVRPNSLRPEEADLVLFVEMLLGLERRPDGLHKASQITILDMNDAADEVVEVVSSVITRLIFDRLRRADPRNALPVHLILEEAHRYVAERPSSHAIDSSRIFQRIAKEGRKYGAFLILASQRPSEISKTVLSQCSNFMVHRIQNPDDLSHIRQMTPFISDSVMKRLPSLPKQHALIFGNAVNLPTTFRVRNVDPKPKSDDARIRHLWFRAAGEPIAALPPPATPVAGTPS
ncbi:Nucleotidyltransferase [Qipengyuania citrea LAMA 915]|uniref:Nucleotidyltransferase n=1 Tax=Qipengyuania citrea LAMA 915 TaxID=1306953 RepID=A0A0L1KE29_9SPHN|nr:DUF87 domain-containing protein [Qipengyuania citrea]KNH02198.1 Nucleotidyltransferase [Qipengyuania citrea LAMA 915]